MRIGVVCEGPTDYWAVSAFIGASLQDRGISAEFVDLQPALDATSKASGGGWTNAIAWLENNPPSSRRHAYFGGGLFGNGLSNKSCDCILIQIDSDVLDGPDFSNYVLRRYNISLQISADPSDRFNEVQRVLLLASGYRSDLEASTDKHVVAPAVENTDAWCVVARDATILDVESRSKSDVLLEFERCLISFEAGSPQNGGVKNELRRKKYCAHHKSNFRNVETICAMYTRTISMIMSI